MTPQESFKKSAEERYAIPARRWSYRQGAEEGYRKAIEILQAEGPKTYDPDEKKWVNKSAQLLIDRFRLEKNLLKGE